MLTQMQKDPLTVWSLQSPKLLTSPRPRWRSPSSPRWCWSLCMQSPSVALPLAVLFLWAESFPHCTVLACCTGQPCRKRHKFWRRQNIDVRLKFTDFHQTIAVYLSAHRRPIKSGENKKWSPLLTDIRLHTHDLKIRGYHRDSPLRPLVVPLCGLTVSAVDVNRPGLKGLLLASNTGSHGVWMAYYQINVKR